MRVIGTAGHVDHGKSTLVLALTGTNPDRLKEEQEREMTIDLGFAWLKLAGEQVGIVDVPGHRDFIENMLAGVGGIDAVLFVVAADEGVMPQTREHLAILDLLQVEGGVIALTKADLIDDPEWFDLVESDVRQAVQGTVLAGAPLLRVSARTGQGLEELKASLASVLAGRPARSDHGRPRLPIDRVFTMPGFGTVVTGTLLDGRLKLGDEVELLPGGVRGRIRGLQAHKQKEQSAVPGSRTAVNISGVEIDQVQRGQVLTCPGQYRPSRMVDVQFRLLPDASGPLRHSSEMKLFLGTSEVLARVRLLGVDELKPGESGWLQLDLRDPVVAVRGDHYILRRPSPGETIGGGIVIDPQPKGRHRRFAEGLLQQLQALYEGTPGEVLLQASLALGPAPLRAIVTRARLNEEAARAGLDELLASGQLRLMEAGDPSPSSDLLAWADSQWQVACERAQREVENFHRSFPLRRGMGREELKSRLKISAQRVFGAAMRRWAADGLLEESGSLVWRPGHNITFSPQHKAAADRLLARFAQNPFSPPAVKECQAEAGEDVYQALVELGRLMPVSPEVVFRKEDYEQLVALLREHFSREPTLTVIQFRDRLNTSRKYVLAFLEHLDAVGVTVREGDARKLKKK